MFRLRPGCFQQPGLVFSGHSCRCLVGLFAQQIVTPCLGILDGDVRPRTKLHPTEFAVLDKLVCACPRRSVDFAEIANREHSLVHAQLQLSFHVVGYTRIATATSVLSDGWEALRPVVQSTHAEFRFGVDIGTNRAQPCSVVGVALPS